MSMKDHMRLLDTIYKATGGPEKKKENEKPVDRFTQLRREIADDMKKLREDIRIRNQMLERGNDAKTAAKSHEIREALKRIRLKQQELEQEFLAQEKKNPSLSTPISPEEMKTRRQAVEMLAQHVAQAEELDRKGFTSDRDALFSQLAPVTRVAPLSQDIELRELPQEFLDQMRELDDQEDAINRELDRMLANVSQLHEIAIGMKEELGKQDGLIGDLTTNTDKQTSRLKQLNRRLKEVLKAENCGAQRFIIWIVLIVILISLILVIWNLVRTRTS